MKISRSISFWLLMLVCIGSWAQCPIQTLPFYEGFNSTNSCWHQEYVSGYNQVYLQNSSWNITTSPWEGKRYLWWNSFWYIWNSQTRVVSPRITTVNMKDILIQFYWMHDRMFWLLSDGVYVEYSTDGTHWNTVQFINRYSPTLSGWQLKTIQLPSAAAGQAVIYVGLRFVSRWGNNCSLDAFTVSGTPNPVPVELIEFNGQCNGDNITLDWSTATESNNDYFVIEGSQNAQTWEEMTRINGSGNTVSLTEYSTSFKTENQYFRLTQVDYDGMFEIFAPIYVQPCKKHDIYIGPNPTNSILNFSETVSYELFSTDGKILLEGDGNTLDLGIFSPGLYVIKIQDDLYKVVKQ